MRTYLQGAAIAVLAYATMAQPAWAADAAATATADASVGTIAEVVVTAEKRENSLQKTAIAMAVIDQNTVADRHIESLINLADGGIPSLRIATFEARQSALTVGIRGIVPFDANQTARDQGVGVYIDGVYLGRQQGLNAALFDIQRIEVLKGPQGTLFGRNTEGGALSIVTKGPTGAGETRLTAGVGNYGSYSSELHVDFPAIHNLAFKVDGVIQHQDPTVKDPLAGQTGWNFNHRVGGRLAARWTPTDALSVDLSTDYAKDENTPFFSQLVSYNPLGKTVLTTAQMIANPAVPAGFIAPLPSMVHVHTERQSAADVGVVQQPSVDQTHGVMGTVKYRISDALELRSISAWRGVTTYQWDNSGGPNRVQFAPNGKFARYSLSDLFQHQFSQEFQAVGSIPQFDYVAGLYYFNERAEETAASPSTNQWNADGSAYTILNPIAPSPNGWQEGYRGLVRASWANAKSYAAFAQATYTPAGFDKAHLTVGGRYTKDERNGLLYVVQVKPANFGFTYNANRFDPMVTLAYDAAPGINLYAKYSTGYRAGGANDRSQTFTPFNAESVKSYELGAKMDLLDRRVRLNLAGYMMDRTGTQTDFDNVDTAQGSPTFNLHTEETRNAPGISKIKGFEADLTAKPTDDITLGFSYAYTDVKIPATKNPFLNNVLFPVQVVFTPPNAASGYIDYEVPVANGMNVRLHLDGNYSDAQYSFQAESVKTDKSFIMNGRLALAGIQMANGGMATLSLWSRNLLDESHIYRRSAANNAVLGDYANFNPPRTFGVEAAMKF
jgi:iron complex outermembrane receptor protein